MVTNFFFFRSLLCHGLRLEHAITRVSPIRILLRYRPSLLWGRVSDEEMGAGGETFRKLMEMKMKLVALRSTFHRLNREERCSRMSVIDYEEMTFRAQ